MKEIKLDEKRLQEMAAQYAMQGAEKAIKDFYTGYDSPFMNAIQRELKEKMETNLFFELSQMTAAISSSCPRTSAVRSSAPSGRPPSALWC